MGTQSTPGIKPKVSTITGFVRINADTYKPLITNALVALRKAAVEFESAGYDVGTLRVTTPPLAEFVGGMPQDQALAILQQLNDLSTSGNFVLNLGPAMVHDSDAPSTMLLLERALATMPNIEGSAIIADSDGVHWDTIRLAAELVQYVSEHSPYSQGNINFAAIAMANPYSPFFPGSYFTEEGQQFAIGLEGANIVHDVLLQNKGNYVTALPALTSGLTQQISSAVPVVLKIQQETAWNSVGVNLILSRLGDVSVATAIEAYTGESFGSGGTLTAVRLIAEAMQSAEQSGNSILTFLVMEEELLAERWAENSYGIDSLLAYSAAGSAGMDTVPLPGNIHPGQLKRIFSDVAVLAGKCNTPLSVRVLIAAGKKPGDMTDFNDPSLFNTMVHTLP